MSIERDSAGGMDDRGDPGVCRECWLRGADQADGGNGPCEDCDPGEVPELDDDPTCQCMGDPGQQCANCEAHRRDHAAMVDEARWGRL